MKYIIRDRETGTLIYEFNSRREAQKELEAYEEQDKRDGIYEEGFYEIVSAGGK